MVTIQEAKAKVQAAAEKAFERAGEWGSMYMATGSGKSKIAVDRVIKMVERYEEFVKIKEVSKEPYGKLTILISVPTEKLRDEGWKAEFFKWTGSDYIWDRYIEKTCYASLDSLENGDYSLVILDEGHHITNNNCFFFKKNKVKRCLLLTATKPSNKVKIDILKELKLYNPCYVLSLDDAVTLGLVAPYEITIVHMELNDTERNIKVEYMDKKTKQKKFFMQTERERYSYLSNSVVHSNNPFAAIKRMSFLYDVASKTKVAKLLLEHV